MDSFNGHTNEKGINNRVYLNPNFKRSMHVNPKFSQHSTNPCHNNKNKIFINPNFIRLPNSETQMNKSPVYSTENTVDATHIPKAESFQNSTVSRNPTVPQFALSNSRYSLVRHRDDENKAVVTQPSRNMQTIKVNKYKTVSLSDAKKALETTKFNFPKNVPTAGSKQTDSKTLKNINNTTLNVLSSVASGKAYESRYKIVKRNKIVRSAASVSINTAHRKNISTTQMSQKHGKIKLNRKLLKKNNIPCPLFRKYGKCLRHIRGRCGFLHDKKHVTVCRMFVKGMCHNNECLLSHDLCLQKMPTCHFFLQGMCTKDGCPYLHVKLNEKAKICADFLKGYCEKGDNCMNKHVNLCPNFATKGTCSSKQCPYPHQRNKIVKSKKIKDVTSKQNRKSNNFRVIKENKELTGKDDKESADCRYYYKDTTDNASTSDFCNKIKPTRCKLGTLPSFIEL